MSNLPINYQAGSRGVIHAAAVNGQDNNGNTLCRPTGHNARTGVYSNSFTVFYEVEASITCKSCLKAIARAEARAYEVAETRARSIEVQHEMAIEMDAATGINTPDMIAVAEALGTMVENLDRDFPVTSPTYGAAIRPKAWVTAHITEPVPAAPVITDAFHAARQLSHRRTAGPVPGRLLAKSKTGQRRPRRGRR